MDKRDILCRDDVNKEENISKYLTLFSNTLLFLPLEKKKLVKEKINSVWPLKGMCK